MDITLYKFGWLEENKIAELEAIQEFLRINGGLEQAEALHALLFGEVNRKYYPEYSDLRIEDDRLCLTQYDKTEYYHDGSEQARKFVIIQCINQETYLKVFEHGTKEEPDAHNFKKEWVACGEDRFFEVRGFSRDDRHLYIKNFFGISYVKIEISYAI